ncbi:protein of unknown function [Shewanella benthica]|uniref:Uncharacterized protein n=1 Tax=Shewanella benthica TaxID=43661 RepID=A0A330M4Y3_9GAMM|nr:protein of unknown function [Shewanella benthica]
MISAYKMLEPKVKASMIQNRLPIATKGK